MTGSGLVRGKRLDAGWDLVSQAHYVVGSGQVTLVSTNVFGEIPPGHVGVVKERSSLAMQGLSVLGGVIDAGYTGEIKVCLHMAIPGVNFDVQPGDRIAQLIVVPLSNWEPAMVTDRGDDGFGSTGRN